VIENIEGLKAIQIPLNGGIDEESPADDLSPEDAIKMTNFRLSKDGRRIQKREGLQEEGIVAAEDVYGYSTYTNSSSEHCQIAVLEGQLMRKVGSGAWTQIYDWPSSAIIAHTVRPLEIQNKQFIITEKGSRVILSDGTVRQIGITAPTSLPTATVTEISGVTLTLSDLMAYANQSAMDAVWTDGDSGSGASTLSTTDPNGTQGPDGDSKYMHLYSVAGAANYAKRHRTITTTPANTYVIECAVYMDVAATVGGLDDRGFNITYDDGIRRMNFAIGSDGVYVYPDFSGVYQLISMVIPDKKWLTFNIYVTRKEFEPEYDINVTVSYDGVIQNIGGGPVFLPETSASGYTELAVYGVGTFIVDNIKIRSTEELSASSLAGAYKYAVSYIRGGNYGCESNAITSQIGSVSFSGTLNDMTVDSESEYTGTKTRTFTVKVTTTGNPDTIKWSEDGGTSWKAAVLCQTEVYLGYGITVNFAAVTGHAANDQWTFTCTVCWIASSFQGVTLSNIPISSDAQVTGRKIYRTTAGGSDFYYLTTISDNTTTSFIDYIEDSALGDPLEYDRDLFTTASSTIGKFSEWWDDRLWIADHSDNVIYYSAIREGGGVPEEFSLSDRFIPIRKGDQGDVITGMKAYKDALYVFKRNDIFVIQKSALDASGYGVFHINSDVGCVGGGSIVEVNDYLMFCSERGIEIYDGVKTYSPDFSVKVNKTWLTTDPQYYDFISAAHDKEFNEAWFSIPSRLSGASAITIVWNYIRNKFYFFQFYKTPSVLSSCKDSTGAKVLKMGTRDGYICLCDYGTADNTTAISATYRKGWMDIVAHGVGRLLQTDYELPSNKTITMNIYVDQDKDVFRTASLTGNSPTSTDADYRRVIGDKTELGVRARYISLEYTNAEDCGGDCKINQAIMYVRPDAIKNKTYAD
jgi:hypothetical protein